jgi:hypothetical protein
MAISSASARSGATLNGTAPAGVGLPTVPQCFESKDLLSRPPKSLVLIFLFWKRRVR